MRRSKPVEVHGYGELRENERGVNSGDVERHRGEERRDSRLGRRRGIATRSHKVKAAMVGDMGRPRNGPVVKPLLTCRRYSRSSLAD
jgi:hypothetical protein